MTDIEQTDPAEELDDAALESWRSRALDRRSNRKPSGLSGVRASLGAWPTWKRWSVFAPVALMTLFLILCGVDLAASAGRIHPGVVASGVEIGGMTTEEASAKLSETLPGRMATPVTVSFETTTWTITAEELDASPETTEAAKSAYAVGRQGTFVERFAARASAWFSPAKVDVPVSADDSATAASLMKVTSEIDRAPVDATVVISGTTPSISSAKLGRKVDAAKLEKQVLAALIAEDKAVTAHAELAPVRVTDEGAAPALEEAKKMLSGPASVTYETSTWEFTPEQIATWLAFRIAGDAEESTASADATPAPASARLESGTEILEAYVSSELASASVTAKVGSAGKPAVNASFKASGGTVSIVPHQDGVGPDITSLANELTIVLKGDAARTVALRTQRVEPEITTEDAKGMGIKERISTYTTTYDSGNKPRVNNIHTLADAIDGTLIPPGGTFSFNGAVGPRTAAKGYQEAPAIVNGKLVPQLGGGICQVGTTVFNSVFESGLPIVERKNHSFYISHYPKGRDATVSWGGPDLKFKNDTPNWVLLATGYSNSSLTISLYGTDPGYEVTASTGSWTDVKPHPVKETPDPTLALGKRTVEDSGVDGRTIVVKRTVKKGGTVIREDTFKSVYKPKEEVVLVGTAPVPGTTPTATP